MKNFAFMFLMALSIYGSVTLVGVQLALAQGSGHSHGTGHSHGLGPHGGQIGEADAFHVEMVTNKSQVDIYIYDANIKPLRVDQFEVSAVVQFGKLRDKIDFVSVGGNQMKGASALMVEPGAKIVILMKPKGKPQVQVRFGM